MKIFFSGIGGSGVSAIAGFMAGRGHIVSGSDRLFDGHPDLEIWSRLRNLGISLVPQDGTGIDGSLDLVIFSTAVENTNPDFRKALEIEIPIKTRPEYLAEIVGDFRTVAVAGTSGKSTTAGMLAFLMRRIGMETNFIGGGRVKQFRTRDNPGNYLTGDSDSLIIEACESDGSIVNYMPEHSLILNLDLDHHSVTETAVMFRRLSSNTRGMVITGADDENLSGRKLGNTIQFSIERKSRYQAAGLKLSPLSSSFKVNNEKFKIALPGKHNVYNALACIAFLSETGVEAPRISDALSEFSGIERRFDVHLNEKGCLVVDDYAHNPHKIANLMATMGRISRRVCYIFQPHGYGPVRMMKEGYIRTFSSYLREDDLLVLLPIYYAGGTASKDVSSKDIAEGVRTAGKKAEVIETRNDVITMPKEWEGYAVFGARDDSLSTLAEDIAENIRTKT